MTHPIDPPQTVTRIDLEAALNTSPAVPPRELKKLGRPVGQSSDVTRERILDSAERLFAVGGFDGTSLRDVASASDCQVQAVSYHFGAKEQLFDTVIQRRARIMSDIRMNALALELGNARGEPVQLDHLIRAYIQPFVLSASKGDPGWRNYAALMGRLANSTLGTEVIARHYDETAQAYIVEFGRSLPDAQRRVVLESFMNMVACMLSICAKTGRVDRLAQDADPATADAELDRLVTFLTAGFRALADMKVLSTSTTDQSKPVIHLVQKRGPETA